MIPRRQNLKSMTPSVILLIAIFVVIIGFIVVLSIFVGRPTSPHTTAPPMTSRRKMTSSKSSRVTSSACHVVENKTMCFRFASNLTTSRCSAVEGVIINANSSSSTATFMMCYHNVCLGHVVDNRLCFLNRSPYFLLRPLACNYLIMFISPLL